VGVKIPLCRVSLISFQTRGQLRPGLPFWAALLWPTRPAEKLTLLAVQARGLIASPFSGEVISGFSPCSAICPPLLFIAPWVLALLCPLLPLALDHLWARGGYGEPCRDRPLRPWPGAWKSLWLRALLGGARSGRGPPGPGLLESFRFTASFEQLARGPLEAGLGFLPPMCSFPGPRLTVGLAGLVWLTFRRKGQPPLEWICRLRPGPQPRLRSGLLKPSRFGLLRGRGAFPPHAPGPLLAPFRSLGMVGIGQAGGPHSPRPGLVPDPGQLPRLAGFGLCASSAAAADQTGSAELCVAGIRRLACRRLFNPCCPALWGGHA